jgi:hypothetical protein
MLTAFGKTSLAIQVANGAGSKKTLGSLGAMDKVELADAVYARVFPIIIIICAVVGTASFALHNYSQAVWAFLAIGLAMKLNGIIERRRFERSERLAALGWNRARNPLGSF